MSAGLPAASELPRVAARLEHDGLVLRLELDAPPTNVLDTEMVRSLRKAVRAARDLPDLRLLVFTGAGDHFSYGASVEEHLPDRVAGMLAEFHGLFRDLMETDVPTLAYVRGRCLGGGLELASFCDWLWAEETATLGQPEIKLGVFAPLGSLLLPWRCGAQATGLLLTGEAVDAITALTMGLADHVVPTEDGTTILDRWIRDHLLPLSASSLRRARRAARWNFHRTLAGDLDALERFYLEDLMATPDAEEGIRAFLEKRNPEWSGAGDAVGGSES